MQLDSILHDKPHFYKYCSARVAKLLLEQRAVKWSSPISFNDPFDLQIDIAFDYDPEDLIEPFLDELVTLTFSDDEPDGNINHPLFAQILLGRTNRHNFSEDTFRAFMKPAGLESLHNMKVAKSELDGWWGTFRQNLRVFCVSEINDDLLMWAHYSDCHRGVVFKLKCIKELNRPLCAAIPIIYQEELPIIASLDDHIKHLTGQINISYDNIFTKFATTKSDHWSYEKEWRCIGSAQEGQEGPFKLEPILPQEIEAVYLGCNICPKDKEDILNLLTSDLEHAQIYQAKKKQNHFALRFVRIK